MIRKKSMPISYHFFDNQTFFHLPTSATEFDNSGY